MSNHSGSWMVNEILELLEKQAVFTWLGPEKTQQMVAEILRIGGDHDCNRGEMLEGIGKRLKICYLCAQYASRLTRGICPRCMRRFHPQEVKKTSTSET